MLVKINRAFHGLFQWIALISIACDSRWIIIKLSLILSIGILILPSTTVAATALETKAPHLEELLTQARTQSRVPVIVTLVIDDAKSSDPAAIDAAQQQLLAELAHFHVENIKTYRYLPMLAFSVEPVALGYLLGSPVVKIIQLDKLEVIQNPDNSLSDHK